jgi:hypothetical protein
LEKYEKYFFNTWAFGEKLEKIRKKKLIREPLGKNLKKYEKYFSMAPTP